MPFDLWDHDKRASIITLNNISGGGGPGIGILKVDGKVVATKTMAKTLPMTLQWDGCFDIGSDTRIGVNDCDYKPPFRITGDTHQGAVCFCISFCESHGVHFCSANCSHNAEASFLFFCV